jgi:hypothetical protein
LVGDIEMFNIRWLVLLWLPFASCISSPGADALILEVTGDWQLDHKTVVQGMGLSTGQIVRLDTGKTAGKIIILYRNGEKRSCPDKDRPVCLDITVDNVSRKPTSVWERVFAVLEDAFNSDSRSVPGLTKSASIADGFAMLSHGNLMIHSPGMPLQLGQQAYTLQFRRFTAENALAPSTGPSYQWRPGASFAIVNVKPGLYRVNLLDKSSRPTGDFFLLLVLEEGAGGHAAEDFETLVASTRAWDESNQTTALATRRLFLWQNAKMLGWQEAR